jgi:hypothetical protein
MRLPPPEERISAPDCSGSQWLLGYVHPVVVVVVVDVVVVDVVVVVDDVVVVVIHVLHSTGH